MERLLKVNNAVPVAAGRGHWKAADIIFFPSSPKLHMLDSQAFPKYHIFYLFMVEILLKK